MNSLRGTCTVRVIQGNVIENATFAFVYYIILFVFFYFLILFLDVELYMKFIYYLLSHHVERGVRVFILCFLNKMIAEENPLEYCCCCRIFLRQYMLQ